MPMVLKPSGADAVIHSLSNCAGGQGATFAGCAADSGTFVNLMPTREKTETQPPRLIDDTPLQVEIARLRTGAYESRDTDQEYQRAFFRTLQDVQTNFSTA